MHSGDYLKEIYGFYNGWNEENVVYWYRECGAVSVDKESDGRRFGSLVPMKFPETLKERL